MVGCSKLTTKLFFLISLLISLGCGKDSGYAPLANIPSCADTVGYCIIFVSSSSSTGDFDTDNNGNGIEEADEICQNDPNRPTSSIYKAMIVDGVNRRACTTANCATGGTAEHIDWVMRPSVEYRRSDETTSIQTTTSNGVFPSGDISASISTTSNITWTGMSNDFTTSGDCNNWSSSNVGDQGDVGQADQSGEFDYLGGAQQTCDTSTYRVYCVEQ